MDVRVIEPHPRGMGKVKSNLKRRRPTFIREWRQYRGLTLERLAARVGVTAGALSQLERGLTNYTQPMLEALADALGCEPADLLMRRPGGDDMWTIYESLQPAQKHQAREIIKALKLAS